MNIFSPFEVGEELKRINDEHDCHKSPEDGCNVCNGEERITKNEGQDNEFEIDCPDCVGVDDSDFTGVTEDR